MNDSRIKMLLGFVFLTLFNATTCVPIDPNAGQTNPDETACGKFDFIDADIFAPSVVKIFFQLKTCDDQPWEGVKSERFTIKENGETVSVESEQDFSKDPKIFQLATILLLDMSGSIVGTFEKPGSLPELQVAARAFLKSIDIGKDHTVAIYTFDGRAEIQMIENFTEIDAGDDEKAIENNLNILLHGIDSLSFHTDEDNSTNLNGAILQSLTLLDKRKEKLKSEETTMNGSLVVFTDGTDQASRVSDAEAIRAVKSSNHRIYSIGLSGEVDRVHLEDIGEDGHPFAENVLELKDAFDEVAIKIKTFSNSFYALTYCSPKRSGKHTLTISLEGASNVINHNFNADNFGGTCSSQQFQNKASGTQPGSNGDNNTQECLTQSDCQPDDSCSIGVCYDGFCSYFNVCIGDG